MDRVLFHDKEVPALADMNKLNSKVDDWWKHRTIRLITNKDIVCMGMDVTENSPTGMSVLIKVDAGEGYGLALADDGQFIEITSDQAEAIATADPGNPRIDTIAIKEAHVNANQEYRWFRTAGSGLEQQNVYTEDDHSFSLTVVEGTPAADPVAPATPAGYLKLAEVTVGAGATEILNANIKDVDESASWTTEANGTVRNQLLGDFRWQERSSQYLLTYQNTTLFTVETDGRFHIDCDCTTDSKSAFEVYRIGACVGSYGIYVSQLGGTVGNIAIWGRTTGSGSSNMGVQGTAEGAGLVNFGVKGKGEQGTTLNYGGHFEGTGSGTSDVYGIYAEGIIINVLQDGWGGYFKVRTTGSAGSGLKGLHSEAIGPALAVMGIQAIGQDAGAGNENYGGHFTASGTATTNYGIVGTAAGATTNWAGYFADGNVYISNKILVANSDAESLNNRFVRIKDGDAEYSAASATIGLLTECFHTGAGGSTAIHGAAMVDNASDPAIGLFGQAQAAVNGATLKAVEAQCLKQGSETSLTAYGFYTVNNLANNSGTNYGIYAEASGATTNYAGYFNGSVYITGTTNYLFQVTAAITSSLVGAAKITRTGACSTSFGLVITQTGGTANNRGIFSETTGVGVDNYGIYGQATGAGTTNYGVFGEATGATTNWAGYFNGLTYADTLFVGGTKSGISATLYVVGTSGNTAQAICYASGQSGLINFYEDTTHKMMLGYDDASNYGLLTTITATDLKFGVNNAIKATIDAATGDLILENSLRVGVTYEKASEAFTYYIILKDKGGTQRKVMVCA